MKKLPIGIQTFEEIIKEDYLYVDKTKQIYDIITTGKTYFISRPRRFGKSLLCSTLEQVFIGNKELFKGLWIYNSEYSWESHPVIRIDMSKIAHETPGSLELGLHDRIDDVAEDYDISLASRKTLQGKFLKLVKTLSKKNKVVIIVDEYDKPILDHITDIELAEKMRDALRNFYTMFKALDEYLKFVFLTGVTKFSKTSVFSGLNNLYDLTFSDKASTLFGYTQKELEFYFRDRIIKLASKHQTSKTQAILQLKDWYNGYRFIEYGKKVYNPFSILLVLSEFKFKNYWFETGTPTFLIQLIKKQNYKIQELESVEVGPEDLSSFEIEDLYPLTVFYQTGYLTIIDYNERSGNYRLSYPNKETKSSFLRLLIKSNTSYKEAALRNFALSLRDSLEENNIDTFIQTMKSFYANIPYTVQTKQNEQHYQFLFYALLTFLGFNIITEDVTNIGRIDAVIKIGNYIYIFEFKINQTAGKALKQIDEKKYYQKYLAPEYKRKKIVAVGVNFDMKEKNISDWDVFEINS